MAGILEKVRKVRGADLQRFGEADLPEKLQQIGQFLQDSSSEVDDYTHAVPKIFTDWWAVPKTNKMVVQADSTSTLHRHIAELWNYGVPLMLCERRPHVFRFFLNIVIVNPPGSCVPAQLMDKDGSFVGQVSRVMGALFPNRDPPRLDMVVFDGSGVSRSTESMETVLRMVWPAIGVTAERAQQIRDYMVLQFKESQDHGIQGLAKDIASANGSDDNPWAATFPDAAYTDRAGVRMPLCDAVLSPPLVKPEGRPLNPHSVLRANYEDQGKLTYVEYVAADTQALPAELWVKVGCIRPTVPMEVSDWAQPKAGRIRLGDKGKVHTKSGSDGGGKPGGGGGGARGPQAQASITRAEAPITSELEWMGTAAEFQRVLADAHSQLQWAVEQDGRISTHVGQVRVELQTSRGKALLTGLQSQVRPLLLILRPHSGSAQPPTVVTAAAPAADARLPSNVYAPATALQPAVYQHLPSNVHPAAIFQQVPFAPVRAPVYMSNHAFNPETAGELELAAGDKLEITELPKAADDGWAKGLNLRTGMSGWFPFNYVTLAV